MAQATRTSPTAHGPREGTFGRWLSHPAIHCLILAAVAVYYLAVSWRRWPDPVSDFGRELYLPWQLAEGAVLYRDVDDFYGPFSQYVNAGLFRLFGSGMMVLVWANLVVFAAIVTTLYFLVRRAWGAGAALGAMVVFVAVFGFSRFLFAGNFNYAAPYAHETTHGMLVVVILAAVLLRWIPRPGHLNSATVGLLFGLTLVIKPEFIFSAAGAIATALILQRRQGVTWSWSRAALIVLGAAIPTLGFVGYFSRHVGVTEAWSSAGRAWLSVVATTRYVTDPAQARYAGLDTPWLHLREHAAAVAMALVIVGLLVAAGRWLDRRRGSSTVSGFGIVGVIGIGLAATLAPRGFWTECGRSLFGLLVAYLAWMLWERRRGLVRSGEEPAVQVRILLTVIAATLMARMILNGRIYHFGYYQAALAGVVVTAALLGELPARVATTSVARVAVMAGVLAVFGPAIVALSRVSHETYRSLTVTMGEGRDRFYVYGAAEPLARIAAQLSTLPEGRTLLVLPEGLMLNYLPRLRSPLAPFFYYSAVTEGGGEARLVEQLGTRPPDYVITVPRDLSEYGIRTYGERAGAGGDLMRWVAGHYEGAPGDTTPLAYRSDAIQVLRRKSGSTPGGASK